MADREAGSEFERARRAAEERALVESAKRGSQVPGSKSYSQSALVIASLADGKSILRNTLVSEDTHYLVEALRLLGAGLVHRTGT